jgi:hypothetical protein
MLAANPDQGLQNWICKEALRLSRTLKPWLSIGPEVVQGFALALQPACSAIEVTSVINEAILRKWPNLGWPSPAELRELLREVRARDRVIGSGRAASDCRLCGGTGFEVISQRGARVAAPCRCRAPRAETK